MDARTTQTDIAGMATIARPRDAVVAQDIQLAAARARDEAVSRGITEAFTSVGHALRALTTMMASIGARARAERELRGLTDRELADIGLTRGDIPAVLANDVAPAARPGADRAPMGNFARAA
ncbi:uncharacterized protein DUF1127 [Humitalea rosea]|uniref:Uncharacterized protein DUF1127 n=1 Tax=Humitalea rosea TaxID=990373 RepID=A0A2W7IFJ3_9PROT|nr:DUF1127 domain-containing protein [Humitalea rosea]PZW45678.1 uncharacterized protein DUF1127 [Humitalea rosea]